MSDDEESVGKQPPPRSGAAAPQPGVSRAGSNATSTRTKSWRTVRHVLKANAALNTAASANSAIAIVVDDAESSLLSAAVLEACGTVQPESVEKLKGLITWQRSSIASLAVKVRGQEAIMADEVANGLQPAANATPPDVISRDSARWAETQLTLAFLTEGGDPGAQRLLQAVRALQAAGGELPVAPAELTEAADGVDPIGLCSQLLAELSQLATLHSRGEWLEARVHRRMVG